MAQQSTPSSDANVLRVGVVGTTVEENYRLLSKWYAGESAQRKLIAFSCPPMEIITMDVGKYSLRLYSGEAPPESRGIHALVIVYDMVGLNKNSRDEVYDSWISSLRRFDYKKTAFILVIKHGGKRPVDGAGIPGDCDLDRLLNSLPGSDREVVVYYDGDDQQRYSEFRPVLLEAALRGHKRCKKCRICDCCCLL